MLSHFQQPINELYGLTISLANLIATPAVKELEDQLTERYDVPDMIRLIEVFLVKQLKDAKPDLLIEKAVHLIRNAVGNISMRSLADTLCIGPDAFEKRFRRMVGCTSKQFAYITRMKHFIFNKISNSKLTEPALAAGFYDHSHFNREFKQFTGLTPSEFFRSPYFW